MQIPQVIVSPPMDNSPPEYRKLKEFIPVYVATIRKTIDSGFLSLYPREFVEINLNEALWRKFIRQINESAQYVSESDATSTPFFGVSGYLASRAGEKNVRNAKIKEINNILLCWNSSFFNGFGLQVTLIKLAQSEAGDAKKISKFGTLKYYLLIASL
ncbi:hypothetical protein INT44_002827 [Umbelopsis vinacea]|uniref:Uncharacterized protein n=1 Tax=Umbelopsis vinacea TaxID=44442 RepID=A0A8H7Q666_9FUNG|nr:hypothetical protein INT44_002827 [Umbelopsis vinacea]